MPFKDNVTTKVSSTSQTYQVSSFGSLTGATGNPAYLVVSALDRNEYTVAASGATGSFSGNGNALALSQGNSDGRAADIIYNWQASTSSYVNATYGALSSLTYCSSGSANDVTNISFWGCSTLSQAQSLAGDPYALMYNDAAGYDGSTTIVTDPRFSGAPSSSATPNSIAAVAAKFVNNAWNSDGCWVLASTIAAEAGAGLPVQSTAVGLAGQANGEWYVAYNGPVTVNTNWQGVLTAGDIVVIATGGNSGHITTVVSGSGSTAQLIDNITYIGANGQIANSAKDGSPKDILVASPHAASQEFAGVPANSVVVYALDTPVVSPTVTSSNVNWGGTLALSGLATAKDPTGKAVTQYQVYLAGSADTLLSAGKAVSANSAASAVTVSSLAGLTFQAASFQAGGTNTAGTSATDTIYVRASNGNYWGDWQALNVAISAGAPKLAAQTAAQTWQQGSSVNFTLPSGTFTDPQKSALTYTASGLNGNALPSWLSFNASTATFSGTVPGGLESFPIVIKATDAFGLSTSETFSVTVPAAAPRLATQMAAQSVTANQVLSFGLPDHSFIDPQAQSLTLSASLASGAALPSWLKFNASTGVFSGTAPAALGPVSVKVTATDTSKLSASETFTVTVKATAPQAVTQTNSATLTIGQVVNFTLPGNAFTDPQGEKLSFMATTSAGAALPSWLHFNGATGNFSGAAPNGLTALDLKITATDTSLLSASSTLILDFAPAGTAPGGFAGAAPESIVASTGVWTAHGHGGLLLPGSFLHHG